MTLADLLAPIAPPPSANLRRVRRIEEPSLMLRESVCPIISTHVSCVGKNQEVPPSAPSAPPRPQDNRHSTQHRAGTCPHCWSRGRFLPLQTGACPRCGWGEGVALFQKYQDSADHSPVQGPQGPGLFL